MSATSSQLFCPFRAVGFCCNHVPLVTTSRGPDSFVVTAVGKSFHQYRCDKLQLLFVGCPQPHPLECVAVTNPRLIWAAYRDTVKAFSRGREVACYRGHKGNVHILLPFGDHLVSIDDQNCLKIWAVKAKELYGELYFDPSSFPITCAMHPSTYLNKILLASRRGDMQLWNVRTSKLVYSFTGWGSGILSVVQSPAVDVVGVGLENGGVVLHNLRYDETVMRFQQEWGPVTALSFRTDGINTVASASPSGNVAVWDLDKRRLSAVIRDAHHGAVTGMQFLPSQPLLLTSGPDNNLKMWIFDQSDGSARLLRSRCGHSAPPTRVRFWSRGGIGLLSAGLDNSLRFISIARDVQSNKEFSQGSLLKKARAQGVRVETLKLPPVTDLATELTRAREWDGVVTCHAGLRSAHTWHLYNHAIGKHKLRSKHKTARPLCVAVTGCGNFCVLGMSTGHVEMFNLQSGLHRGEFGGQAHWCAVRGVAVNAVNTEVYSGASDGTIRFWSFHAKNLLHSAKLPAPIASLVYHRESCMLAVACDDFTLHVVDTDTRRVVRIFTGHTNRITDMVFSPDSRWLLSSAMDCSIRTWDLPTGRLLDCFLVEAPPTSLTISATSDFLATTHVDDLGIYLWSNKTLYSPLTLRPLPPDFSPLTVDLPGIRGDEEGEGEGEGEEEGEQRKHEEETEEEDVAALLPLAPLGEGLITLSTLPKSHWSNLQNLDVIKQRNKPIEPPKQPKPAPFFLPTLTGLVPKFVAGDNEGDIPNDEAAGSKIIDLGKLEPLSEFQKCLENCAATGEFSPFMELLRAMSPSAIDREFRSLSAEAGGSEKQLHCLLRALLHQLDIRQDFELVQAYLGLVLKLHSGTISKSAELADLALQLLEAQQSAWQHLHRDLNMAGCLLAYFKSATV